MPDYWCAGQRVAIYTPDGRFTGELIQDDGLGRWLVSRPGADNVWFHRKQLRKLRPKRKALCRECGRPK